MKVVYLKAQKHTRTALNISKAKRKAAATVQATPAVKPDTAKRPPGRYTLVALLVHACWSGQFKR